MKPRKNVDRNVPLQRESSGQGTTRAGLRRHLVVTPSLRPGGAERTLINVLQRMGPQSSEVDLIIGLPGGELESEVPLEINRKYLFNNRIIGRVLFWLFRNRVLRFPLRMVWRAKIHKSYETAVSFQDCFLTDLVSALPVGVAKVSVVHSNCETNPDYRLSDLSLTERSRLLEARYQELNTIAFVSESAKSAFARSFGELPSYIVLPILFSPSVIRQLAAQYTSPLGLKAPHTAGCTPGMKSRPFRFICVGSLLPVKNHKLLLYGASLLAEEGHEFQLDIVGDGPLRSEIERTVSELDLSDRVIMHGYAPNPYPLIASSDALVLPSISEAMPTVVCEAHALGIPVLASDCEGCRELLGGGTYGVVFEQTSRALSGAMKKLLTSKEHRQQCIQKGRRWLAEYNEKKTLRQYCDLVTKGGVAPYARVTPYSCARGSL